MDLYRQMREASPIFSELELRFAERMTAFDPGGGPELFLAAAGVLWCTRRGHVCLDIVRAGELIPDDRSAGLFPKTGQWLAALGKSPVVGRPGDYAPLVLDDRGRLYLHRYWTYQQTLAGFIRDRAGVQMDVDMDRLKEGLGRLFPGSTSGATPDMQQVAAVCALTRKFCVISGGPGTGKTVTAAKILALLADQYRDRSPAMVLAAPTGKAAARLGEAVSALRGTQIPDGIVEVHPFTLHRLLGAVPGSTDFRRHRGNPVAADVVVVDEASMVDIALMARLVDALPDHCRLILVGDRDQLASVEAGSVFADICGAAERNRFSGRFVETLKSAGVTGKLEDVTVSADASSLSDNVVHLEISYRFTGDSGIGRISRLARDGRGDRLMDILESGGHGDVAWTDDVRSVAWRRHLEETMEAWARDYLSAFPDKTEVFKRFESFRVLCALRDGPFGAVFLNRFAGQVIGKERLADTDRLSWYHGRPVMVLKNDYHLGLFNGDIGITLFDEDRRLRVFFRDGGGLKSFHPGRIPEHETVYAMTVHKSQGTEFDRVVLVLPDRDGPLLTRELIYTALTRAKSHIEIVGKKDIVMAAVTRPVIRASGLSDAIVHARL
ncbi:MAG: exodeoxyribonuclease V subunit alpha [Thermodesulfobacteriota bacterium]